MYLVEKGLLPDLGCKLVEDCEGLLQIVQRSIIDRNHQLIHSLIKTCVGVLQDSMQRGVRKYKK